MHAQRRERAQLGGSGRDIVYACDQPERPCGQQHDGEQGGVAADDLPAGCRRGIGSNDAQAQQLLGGRLSACDHGEQGEHRGDGRAFACPERGVLDTEAGKQPASVHSVHGEIAAPGKRLRKRKVESERQRAPRGGCGRSALGGLPCGNADIG